ncbi:type III-B CRISPR-associated protein Cas10/Cmr2 [Tepidimonas charontis]|uniref:CRISPR-associated protein Cas10/Cmr2, subtype III-B n=1 Tax=Tepidimonas charontis TaxID=2267262 RepID=A0A554X3I1_9BURK|nr:type III-B CRISPR-associated protein Cas10/Cmr2 [Tepidimonas charontis]TSE30401.1 CRISPR-associated protein Cas10/Cmr2, subtype III-B [Tepidimonas charontis]
MTLWKTKLAAWLHDPAEKALVLLRDKTGHEWGTVAKLREALFGSRAIPTDIKPILERADWYAAAADRPQWPLEEGGARYAKWTQVDFAERPVLIHPLTGVAHQLRPLTNIPPEHLKTVSHDHFNGLILRDAEGRPDYEKTLLAYWRFGPDTPAKDLHHLWQNLPADTRVPDHSIWAHLDLVSALAGAMAGDPTGTPALLAVSFGPVQGFIAEARTTSDLWAGSHLLARIAWEGMRVVCERLGPDAILFPSLRGVPLVDRWLRDAMGLPGEWFQGEDWASSKTDANPLFAAALPNRFVAIVPTDQAASLAGEITRRVRDLVVKLGEETLRRILEEIGEAWRDDLPCVAQLKEQLADFPEVHWAAVSWSLAEGEAENGRPRTDTTKLREALARLYPEGEKVGFLDGEAWRVLSQGIELDGARFYDPNPGTLYPALYDLLDRVAAAAKTVRPFAPLKQTGYRSTINGEREWLTLDRSQLALPPGSRQDTLWTRLAAKRPSWVKPGEHLDALAAIKRLWPTLFTEEVRSIVGQDVRRYVVSTHTLALAVSMARLMEQPANNELETQAARATLNALVADDTLDSAALPRKLAILADKASADAARLARKLPALLDRFREAEDEERRRNLENTIKRALGSRPEAYYGLLLLDGDRMGAWLSGGKDGFALQYRQCWHPQIRESDAVRDLSERHPALRDYLNTRRPPSPARHGAISQALNHFSLKTARFVVEDCFKGKLVYAGGDDVLAFVCVDDLLTAMALLRCLYSGLTVPEWLLKRLDDRSRRRFQSGNGWLKLDEELFLTMGDKATASCGAVVAHHQAPLGMVLRTLREAEASAKKAGGRDAFCLRILKRAGGEVGVTDKWFRAEGDGAVGLLDALMRMLARKGVSRRAAYNAVEWLGRLPTRPDAALLRANLAYQFARQGGDRELALRLADYAARHYPEAAAKLLIDFLMTAEFLARNSRHPEAES